MPTRSRALPATLVLLVLLLVLLPAAAAEPVLVDQGGGVKRATWSFTSAADYDVAGTAVVDGAATLAQAAGSRTYATDADFLAAMESSSNVVVGSGVRLTATRPSLVSDGAFDQGSGPWTYADGPGGNVVAEWDPAGRAELSHASPRIQFDSMDAVSGPRPWISFKNGQSTSTVSQSTTVYVEGTGSLKDEVTIGSQGSGTWAGASRNVPGTWNWSAYNRLAVWIEGTNASGLSALVLMTNLGGMNWASWMPQHLASGWNRYVYDISPFSGTNELIDQVQIGFTGGVGGYTVYLDDVVLFNHTAFDETASVSQSFTKPTPTDGSPGSVGLRFDIEATASVNLVAYFRIAVGTFASSESPIPAGRRSLAFDLSSDPALRMAGSFDLTFSLELIRIGTEEASMSVWIDNVTLTTTQYASGSFTARPIDAGSAVEWTDADMVATTNAPATSITSETRTGNTSSPGDPTWSVWQAVSGSKIESPPNRFLQWRLSLNTDGVGTPILTSLGIQSRSFAREGVVRTAPFIPGEPIFSWQSFNATDVRPDGTAVRYEVSVDSGGTWTSVELGQDLSGLATNRILLRGILSTENATRSPSITSLNLWYRPSAWSALLSPWTGVVLLGSALAGYVGWKRFPRRRSMDDLFLIGRDGRLLVHTTARPRGDVDDDILAGMLTAISMFVRETFKREHEELERFELGSRTVAVERGEYVYLAAIYPGALPDDVSRSMKEFLADLSDRYGENLAFWYFVDDLPGLPAMMAQFAARGRYRLGNWRKVASLPTAPSEGARPPTTGPITATAPAPPQAAAPPVIPPGRP